jgi:PAS domain S-box-containing protein
MRILLVENNSDHIELMRLALSGHDSTWEVEAVAFGEEALCLLLGGEVFDLVFLDYSLLGRDGLEVLEEIRRGEAPPPVVVVTGRGDEQVAVKAMKGGAYDYVVKGEGYLQRLPVVARRAVEANRLAVERKRAEEELRERDIQLKKLTSWVPGMIYQFTKRPDGTYCVPFTTEAIKGIFGCSPQDVREDFSPIARIILPEDFDKVVGSIEYSAKHLTIWTCEYRVQIPGQSIRWLLGNSTPEKLADGSITWYGFNTDITDLKQAEEALRESETKLQAIFDTVGTGILIIDRDTQIIIEANQTAIEMTGLPEERIIGQICHSLVCPAQAGKCPVKDLGQSVDHSERKLIHADGHQKDILKTVYPITIKGRDCYLESFIDISDRLRAEEALRESEERLRFHTDNSPMAVVEWNTDFVVTRWTGAAEKMFGWSFEETIGKPIMELRMIYEEDIPIVQSVMQRLTDGKSKYVVSSNRNYTKKGEVIHCEWYNSVLHDSAGKMISVMSQVLDVTERKQAEEALHHQNELLRTILDSIPVMVALFDREGHYQLVNRCWQSTLGWSLEKAQHKDILAELYPDPAYRKYVVDYIAAAAGTWSDFKTKTRDGRVLDTSWVNVPLSGNSNIGIGIDITERKQAEEALRESEEKYREIIENMQEGYHEVDIKGNLTFFNESMRKIIGYEREELLGMNNRQYADEENTHKVYQAYNRVYRTGEPVKNFEWQIITKDGDRRDIEVSISLIRDAEGHPTGFRGIVLDVTDRKRAEEALRDAETRYRLLFEHSPDGIVIIDPATARPLEFNETAHRQLGYSREEFSRLSISDLDAVETAEETKAQIANVIREGRNDFETLHRTRQGEIRNIQVTAQNTEILGHPVYHCIWRDITERKRTEEELRTSRLQLRALATRLQQIREEERIMIAREIHDEMGGGLTGLKMDLSWLLRKMGDADPGEERVALMDKIHTSNALIDQMIQVVRRISTDLRPSILDDLGLIAALEWQLSEFTSRTEIPHKFATTFEYVNMEADTAVAVFRVFQEALTNVVRHSRATKVAVVLRESERSLFGDESFVLEIRDNGRGITEEEILNPESLGLLGMKERVLTFGGELSIRGEPGGGTALVLKIPRKQGEPS